MRIHGRWMTAPDGRRRLLTMKKPVGPCLLITPWNFPLAMGTRKIGPADRRRLHDGGQAGQRRRRSRCSRSPTCSREAGLPDGVLNVVTDHGTRATSARR